MIIIAVLVCAVLALASVNRSRTAELKSDGSLLITADGTVVREFTYDEIRAFPRVSVEKTITSSKEEDESGVFTGVAIESLLSEADEGWAEKYTEFIFHASDGFAASVFKSDIVKGENVIVVYEKDGAALPGPDEGGKGPLRIVVADDPFGNRSAYLLVRIDML